DREYASNSSCSACGHDMAVCPLVQPVCQVASIPAELIYSKCECKNARRFVRRHFVTRRVCPKFLNGGVEALQRIAKRLVRWHGSAMFHRFCKHQQMGGKRRKQQVDGG